MNLRCLGAFFGSNEEIDEFGRVTEKNSQKEAYNYFIDTLLYYSRLFEGNMPNPGDILDMEYFLYYDLIVKQVRLKKQEGSQRDKAQRARG